MSPSRFERTPEFRYSPIRGFTAASRPAVAVANGCYRDLQFVHSNIGFGVRRPITYLLFRIFGASIIPFNSEQSLLPSKAR
jgi:hypothetical protein